ncbi:LOW QUALITY PROTEIN: putative striatin [Schistosoma mansoni]|uniref:putative striatin n=1 Tax=Schistosoma mansoni TaxID=6183 RepID=UPI00022DC46D|nr:LOW QUALITY PROTEIN: putative striatin [Schistosoma mansoni]|eukprot:XP_018647932.1 LOW QUALITY PROTEIN: putative striatin [Schistosoma mansoni]
MDTECFSRPITSVNFQRDAEGAAETFPSIQTKTNFYTMAGILDFLQLEWSRMQSERTQWDVERAELHARIAFLQGKFRGLECLRNDLIRRIKMLEYALIRERSNKTQDGQSKENEENMISVHFSRSDSGTDHSKTNVDSEWQNENIQLSKYLIDSTSSNVSHTFGNPALCDASGVSLLVSDGLSSETNVLQGSLKYDDSELKGLQNSLELPIEHCGLEQNKQSQDGPFDFSLSNSSSFDYLALTEEGDLTSTIESQCITDPETAEALLEFEQLVAQSPCLDKTPSIEHINHTLLKHNESLHKDWDNLNEQELLQRFEEQYRADRSHASHLSLHFPLISNVKLKLKESLNIDDKKLKIISLPNDLNVQQSSYGSNNNSDRPINFDAVEDELDNILPNFTRRFGKSFMSKSEFNSKQAHAVALAMDNLDGMSECLINRSSNEKINQSTPTQKPATWTAKYTLRSHFDAIRDICFHPSESVLVTCSEDHTLKLWNLNKTVQTKKSSMFDVEPIYTFRGHNSPVLSVAMVPSLLKVDNSCQSGLMLSPIYIYSGDLSGCIRSWCVSNLQLDPYDTFDTAMMGPIFEGHTDAVWSLCSRYDGLLLSTSSDGTSRLWHLRPNSFVSSDVYYISKMLNKCENISQQDSTPTSATFLSTNLAQFAAGFNSGHVCLFNLETHQIVRNFQSINKTDVSDTSQDANVYSVNSVISHPHLSLIISAHDDRQIRFWDSLSGKCVHSLTAHLDSVTTLSLNSKGTLLLSASHDCSIRIWDINAKLCIQEITGHRKKFGEAINAVAFHPTQHFMASAGSDALAKVYA